MSQTFGTGFKKPECTDLFTLANIMALKDLLGGLLSLQVVGTDPDIVGTIDGATMTEDYVPTEGNVNPDGSFFIIPETDNAVYVVVLADGSQFTVTAVQSHAYLGYVMPYKIVRVIAEGTTGSFSVVY